MKNRQTTYILKDAENNLFISQYAPDQNYSGQSANDSYSLALGLKCELSHDLWLNDEIEARFVSGASWGLDGKTLNVSVIAKYTCIWDMSLPLGQRATDIKETKNFVSLLKYIKSIN